MARPPVKRVRRSLDEFRRDVRLMCERKFADKYKREWVASWGEALVSEHTRRLAVDGMVRPAVVDLRAALQKAARALEGVGLSLGGEDDGDDGVERDEAFQDAFYAERARKFEAAGAAATQLHRWFDEHLDRRLILPELPSVPRSFRVFLVEQFAHAAANGGEGLPHELAELLVNGAGWRALPTHSELAVISLLCGEFPARAMAKETWATGTMAEREVLKRESDALRRARGDVLSSENAGVVGSDGLLAHGIKFSYEGQRGWGGLPKPRK